MTQQSLREQNAPEAITPLPATQATPGPSEAASGLSWWLRGFIPWLLYFGLILLIAVVLLLVLVNLAPAQVLDLQVWFSQAGRLGAMVQVAIAACIVYRWSRIVAWGRRRGYVSKAEHRAVLRMRWRAARWMALYLLLFPIGPLRLLDAVMAWFN